MNKVEISSPRSAVLPDSFEKGRLFEKYIIELFNQKHFRLVKWRKAQKLNNVLVTTDFSNPDLEIIFAGRSNYKFAIECKWRQAFIDGKVRWAKYQQIRAYEKFEREYRIRVFVAIGIGGEPAMPERLFVTPLCNISRYSEVYERELTPFKRTPTRRFFYDTVQLKLF